MVFVRVGWLPIMGIFRLEECRGRQVSCMGGCDGDRRCQIAATGVPLKRRLELVIIGVDDPFEYHYVVFVSGWGNVVRCQVELGSVLISKNSP